MKRLRVFSFNIHKGFSGGVKRFTLHRMREMLKLVQPDIVFLQEAQGAHDEHERKIKDWPTSSQFEYLADTVWPHYSYGKNSVYAEGHHGNAILSKYPIVSWENHDVTTGRFDRRGLLHAEIELPKGNRLHTICVHLGLFEADRREQIKMLNERIEKMIPAKGPVVVAGDFNDWRGRADLDLSEAFMEVHGEYAKSFPSFFPVLRLDRIYYRDLNVRQAVRFTEPPWDALSDHIPLEVEFGDPKP